MDSQFQRTFMQCIYDFAVKVGQGKIQEAQVQYPPPSAYGAWVTWEFHYSHLGGAATQGASNSKAAYETAAKRSVKRSTTLSKSDIDSISDEVRQSQGFFKQALEAAPQFAMEKGKVIEKTLFLTREEHVLHHRHKKGDGQLHARCKFFYAVAKHNNKYYMHHYEDDEKHHHEEEEKNQSPPWETQEFDDGNKKRKVYYGLSPGLY